MTLPRGKMLHVQADFLSLKEQGKRFVNRYFIVNWRREPEGSVSRFAVIASRRLGGAVVRNRFKRLLREAFSDRKEERK